MGDVSKTCRHFGIAKASFNRWRHALEDHGETGLANKRSAPHNHPNRTPEADAETVLCLRREYYLGPIRIVWYLEHCHGLKIPDPGAYRILKRKGVGRRPGGTRPRKIHTKCYNRQVPEHQIRMDVNFGTVIDKSGARTRRFQSSATDDATRIRAQKIYERHNQANPIDFMDHVVATFPFRIQ